jgi:hypothetical protein
LHAVKRLNFFAAQDDAALKQAAAWVNAIPARAAKLDRPVKDANIRPARDLLRRVKVLLFLKKKYHTA